MPLKALPEGASVHARDVAGFYVLVAGLRRWLGLRMPDVLFGGEWAAGKLRKPKSTVYRALRELEGYGVLAHTDWKRTKGNEHPTKLYAPGPIADGGEAWWL